MQSFFHELQQRHVIRAGIAYLAVAWLLVQLAGEIGPMLGAPETIYRPLLAVLAAGFFVTLILAWVYEITNKGIRRASELAADESLKTVGGTALNMVIIGALSLALAYFVWESRFADSQSGTNQSIAVLPFRDLSREGDQAWFAEGMAEELMSSLARIPDLKIAGRNSSFASAGSRGDPATIGKELGVTYILDGSIQTAGEQLRVSAKLMNAQSGFQVWARDFDRPLGDVFALQDEIAVLVVNGLQAHLGNEKPEAMPAQATETSVEAYSAYLLGRYQLARRNADGIVEAEVRFREAIALDDSYSPAHSALAKTLAVSVYYRPLGSGTEIAAQARAHATRAIDLDPGNSEAFATLGTIALIYDRDWSSAGEMGLRAIELSPGDAGNVNLFGDYFYSIGDYDRARDYESLAARLEPISPIHQHELALVLELLGDVDAAIAQEQLAIQLDPEFRNAWSSLGTMYFRSGRLDELESLLQADNSAFSENARRRLELLLAIGRGNSDEVAEFGASYLAYLEESDAPSSRWAFAYALLGLDREAAEKYEKAYASRDPLLMSPQYFALPEDWPGMPALQAAMNKPDLSELFELRRKFARARVESGPG